jgi:hypothetical protein
MVLYLASDAVRMGGHGFWGLNLPLYWCLVSKYLFQKHYFQCLATHSIEFRDQDPV